jgi:ketopantoate hydroxymethyltransferase
MTPKITKRVTVPRAKNADYAKVAESFYNGAEMAKGFEYWNAAGLLIVHAAIAYTDTLTIKFGGVRSKGEDHMAAVDLLRQVMALDEQGKSSIRHLERIINEKNRVAYEGEIFTKKDVEALWKHLLRYRAWSLPAIEE